MARPKQSEGPSALKRLENAFWDMLAEMPYAEIMISIISRRAKINHNTFYYHFKNMDDLAATMIEENLIPEMPGHILAALESKDPNLYQTAFENIPQQRFQRLCLLAGPHGSAWMRDELKTAVLNLWLDALHLEPEDIKKEEMVVLTFAIAGILAILGDFGQESELGGIDIIVQSDLGKGLMSTIKTLSELSASKSS